MMPLMRRVASSAIARAACLVSHGHRVITGSVSSRALRALIPHRALGNSTNRSFASSRTNNGKRALYVGGAAVATTSVAVYFAGGNIVRRCLAIFAKEHQLEGPFVLAIDQGTSSSRCIVFDSKGKHVASHQVELASVFPQPGWAEQDPEEIFRTVVESVDGAVAQCRAKGIAVSDIKAIGVTNQRETTVLWDRTTGKPLHNAIVWLDTRTASTISHLLSSSKERHPHKKIDKDILRSITGLPLSTYFSATKIKWLLDHVPSVRAAVADGRAAFGTVDSWLIWKLTGGPNSKTAVHVTDVTNASRTLLMNLATLQWDDAACAFFEIPRAILPDIRSSSEIYGHVAASVLPALAGVPIAGCLGDQQAALVGHKCFQLGQAKNTYGTGCFMLLNTGDVAVLSRHGLLTTVAYQMGRAHRPAYALEGSVAIAGAAVRWLRDNLGIIQNADDIEPLAAAVPDAAGVVFVPAFAGLFAPYWRDDARGVIVGLTQYTTKHHLARAVLDAVAFQTVEVLVAMETDLGNVRVMAPLKVDGGMTKNELLMRIQADLLGLPVERGADTEATARGAAYAAGLAVGVYDWDALNAQSTEDAGHAVFYPRTTSEERNQLLQRWRSAVKRSFGLAKPEE